MPLLEPVARLNRKISIPHGGTERKGIVGQQNRQIEKPSEEKETLIERISNSWEAKETAHPFLAVFILRGAR